MADILDFSACKKIKESLNKTHKIDKSKLPDNPMLGFSDDDKKVDKWPLKIKKYNRTFIQTFKRKEIKKIFSDLSSVDKANAISLLFIGIAMLIGSLFALFVLRPFFLHNMRYFLPMPPLVVAAYIFVITLFRDETKGISYSTIFQEMFKASVGIAIMFFVVGFILSVITLYYYKK